MTDVLLTASGFGGWLRVPGRHVEREMVAVLATSLRRCGIWRSDRFRPSSWGRQCELPVSLNMPCSLPR